MKNAEDVIENDDVELDALPSMAASDDIAKARRLSLVTRAAHRPFPATDHCRFELETQGADRRNIVMTPSVLVQPIAVLFWGVGRGALVHQILLGFENQLVGAVPALLFESDISREDFLDRVRPRPDGIGLVDTSGLGKIFRFDMPSLTPQDTLVLDVSGVIAHGVVLARTPVLELPAPEPGESLGRS